MRRETLESLADRHGIPPPADTRGQRFENFGGFNELYQAAGGCIRTQAELARLILEVAEDAASEGVLWIEPAFDAERYCERRAPSDRLFENQYQGWRFALESAQSASAATGVGIGLVSAIDRTQPLSHAWKRMEVTENLIRENQHLIYQGPLNDGVRYPGIVGLGLHGNEEGFPPDAFAEVFQSGLAKTGLLSVPHAGEIAPSPGQGPASVRVAVSQLKADRVLHGVLAASDEHLVEELAEKTVCLDVCPSSNVALSVFDSLGQHPLPALLEAGVRCSLGSDDPLLFGPSVGEEYERCRVQMKLADTVLAQVARCSFEASGAPDALKQLGLNGVDQWLSSAEPGGE